VNERGRLQRVSGRFAGHFVRGDFSQLIVNQRQQFVRGRGLATMHGFEDLSYVVHLSAQSFHRATVGVTLVTGQEVTISLPAP
jgi:hypothetical protein